MSSPTDSEVRDRRRAKILASKDARMARITGALKEESDSKTSLKVDEVVLQEFIAEEKKHAVEVAKVDYSRTHREHLNEKDEKLTPSEIKSQEQVKIKSRIEQLRPGVGISSFLALLVIVLSASSAAYFLVERVPESLHYCLNLAGVMGSVDVCRSSLPAYALQVLPPAVALVVLPALGDFMRGRRSFLEALAVLPARFILFVVIFLVVLRLLIN